MVPKIYTRYDPPVVDGMSDFGPTRAKQKFRDECDLNTLMSKYRDSGLLPAGVEVQYGDFADVGEYQDAQNLLLAAKEQFESLPSAQRERFKNDPVKFLQFVQDKGNMPALRELGMLNDEAAARYDAVLAAEEAKKAADKAAAAAAAAAGK